MRDHRAVDHRGTGAAHGDLGGARGPRGVGVVRGRLVVGAALLLASCGGGSGTARDSSTLPPTSATPSPRGTASATATATARPSEILFAVDETHSGSPQGQPDTVAIVGIDGVARARATLTPRGVPQIGNAAPVLYPVAVAAAGAVWWIDGAGVVRRLAVGDAAPRQVAVFEQSSAQQTLSFAVSPDGSQLEAARVTFSPFQRSTDPNNPFGTGGVPQRVDVMTSPAGGSTALLRSIGSPGYQVLAVVGWSSVGPLAVLDGPVGAQAPVPRPWYGHAAHLDASGSSGSVLGGGSCRSVVAATDDAVVCLSDDFQTLTLRDAGGSQRFQATLAAPVQGAVALSPSADRICTGHQVVGGSAAAAVNLPEAFNCQGWLDASTVIGVLGASPTGEMAVVHLASPGTAVDLGFRGEFDGVVQRPA